LQQFKARLGGAKKGHSLLKKKRDALKARFHLMMKEIVETKLAVGVGLKEASFSFAKAQWANAGDDITSTVVERVKRPSATCKLTADNCAGVSLPVFKMLHDPTIMSADQTIGIAHGGAVITACRQEYLRALKWIVKLASLQTSFKTLDEELKMTSRRVNALEYVLIPRIEDIVSYIKGEMDEQDREEFFRVKKVVEKKKAKIEREKIEFEKEMALKGEAPAKAGATAFDAPSALGAEKDPDVVF